MNDSDSLRALVRDVIRELLPNGLSVTETVDLSTDEDLAAFVARLLDLEPEQRAELRSGRKRFRLAALAASPAPSPAASAASPAPPAPAQADPAGHGRGGSSGHGRGGSSGHGRGGSSGHGRGGSSVRRIEAGAVTERMVSEAARAGERLVLGRAAVLTPLARDRARATGVEIEKER